MNENNTIATTASAASAAFTAFANAIDYIQSYTDSSPNGKIIFRDGKLVYVPQETSEWVENDPLGGKIYINGKPIWITRVLYSGPATIVFWSDDTKTVAKCDIKDTPSREMGLLVAFMKKIGSSEQVNTLLKNWIPESNNQCNITLKDVRRKVK